MILEENLEQDKEENYSVDEEEDDLSIEDKVKEDKVEEDEGE